MATDTRSFTYPVSNDTNFRTWGLHIADSFQAAGLTKTSDTGQIDWTTVLLPVTQNTFAGYEIYRFTTDTHQNTLGCFIKVEYGIGSAASRPALAFTVGTGTDGAGTLTGQVSTRQAFTPSSSASGTNPVYSCGGDGRFVSVTNWNAGTTTASYNFMIMVERTRTANGNTTADGINYFIQGPTSGTLYIGVSGHITATTVSELDSRVGGFLQNRTGNYLSQFSLSTLHAVNRNQLLNPFVGALAYFSTDLVRLQPISCQIYNANRTYLPLGAYLGNVTAPFMNSFGHSNTGVALLWE